MAPPSDVQVGDVLIYHAGSCDSGDAHAVIVVEGGSNAKIACHSMNGLDIQEEVHQHHQRHQLQPQMKKW